MRSFRKKVYIIIWIVIALLGINILFRSFAILASSGMSEYLLSKVEHHLSSKVLETYLPGVIFSTRLEEEDKSITETMTDYVLSGSPLYHYVEVNGGYETEIEDLSAYERILAREESSENEVHHITGELINPEEAMEEENQAVIVEEEHSMEASADTGAAPSTTPVTEYPIEKLKDFDFLLNNFYVVNRDTTITSERLNVDTLLSKDLKINTDNSVPQILIYHTHSQEDFIDSIPGDPSTTIVGVGEHLAALLRENYGYNVIHHTGVYDMVNGRLDRNQAYALAEPEIEAILAANPSVEVVIDLHRDGVGEGVHLVSEVNGKPTAKLMFLNGLSYLTGKGDISYLYNPYIQDNLAFSLQLQLKAMAHFPDATRKIYLRGLRFNQHLSSKSLLVEVGAQTNTLQEEKNAMEVLAELLHMVLSPAG